MKNELVVYWAPNFTENQPVDWNILYNNPVNLLSNVKENVNKKLKNAEMFLCPAVKNMLKNTYFFSSTVGADYLYNEKNNFFEPKTNPTLGIDEVRQSSLNNKLHITLSLNWILFSEEPLIVEITPPYFSDADHLMYGSIVPGTFDIGQWFRSINAEFILKKNNKKFTLDKNEPIMYVRFLTDKKITIKRFYMNESLQRLEKSCIESRNILGRNIPLLERYSIFRNTNSNKKIISIIKNNIVD